MTPDQFCYWLQGFFELRSEGLSPGVGLTTQQIEMIEEHLRLVFKNVTKGGQSDGSLKPKIESDNGVAAESFMTCSSDSSLEQIHHLILNASKTRGVRVQTRYC